MGHDFAGTVEELGLDVPAGARTVGERVGGFVSRNSQSSLSASDFSLNNGSSFLRKRLIRGIRRHGIWMCYRTYPRKLVLRAGRAARCSALHRSTMPTRDARTALAIRRAVGTPTLHPHLGWCDVRRAVRGPVCQTRRLPRHHYSIAEEL